MAKKTKRKSLLPKRIAGVKVPKSVRKGRLGELLASRTGQALLAEAVMAVGAAGVAKQAKGGASAGADALVQVLQERSGKKMAAHRDGLVAFALAEAARAFVQAVNRRRAEASDEPAHQAGSERAERPAARWASSDVEPHDSKKNSISYEAGPL